MDKNIKNTMLVSPDAIKGTGELDYNVDDVMIGSAIRTAQNVYLQDIIGSTLLERIQELVYNAIVGSGESIDDEDKVMYKTLLDEYIENVLINKTMVEITTKVSFKIRNVGVAQNSEENINASSLANIKYIRNNYETLFCDSLNRMVEWLDENKAAFPELEVCQCGKSKPNLKKRYANTNIYLG